jgi:hypothetical protein
MTVTISSSLRVALVSGTGVSFNASAVPLISTDDVYNPDNPAQTLTDLLGAFATAKLAGTATLDGTTVGNSTAFVVAAGENFIPTSVVFALTDIAGSGNPPAINVGVTGPGFADFIDSSRNATYDLSSGAVFAAGSGYLIGDVLSFVGGTHSVVATLTVSSAAIVALNVNAAGTTYAPGDVITLAGGVQSSRGSVTVVSVQLVSATIHSGGAGTGYDGGSPATFNVNVAGGTHSVQATVNVTTDGSGHISAINSVVGGTYTVLPTLSANAATGDDGTHHGTGLTLDLVFGVKAISILSGGIYTTETVSFTQNTTTGTGTGATFNSALYGVVAYTISNAGNYTVVPANHIAVTGGAGTGFTFDAQWAITTGMFEGITTAGQVVEVQNLTATGANSGLDLVYLQGGEAVVVRVAFPATYSTYALKAFVFGFTFV